MEKLMREKANINFSEIKFHAVEKLVNKDDQAINSHCTLLLIFHPSTLKWIKIPCDQKILDKRTVFCTEPHRSNLNLISFMGVTAQEQMEALRDMSVFQAHLVSHLYNLFYCKDGTAISVISVCNSFYDCLDGTDEMICTCTFQEQKTNIPLCVTTCQKPTCICHQPFKQVLNSGCKLFITKLVTGETYKTQTNVGCFTKSIYCKYDIKNKILREQKFCKTGYHLKNCDDYKCLDTFKCSLSYCLPWKYICDGYWDCPGGYDEMECKDLEAQPGFYRCYNSMTLIVLKNVCDGSVDCSSGEDEHVCNLHSVACPKSCVCIAYGVYCQSISNIYISDLTKYPMIYLYLEMSQKFNMEFIIHHKTLKFVSLLRNNLSEICFQYIHNTSVILLNVSNNAVKSLQQRCLANFPLLKIFVAAHNAIKYLACLSFKGVLTMHVLNLAGNKMVRLRYCHFQGLNSLQILDVSFNNFYEIDDKLTTKMSLKKIITSFTGVCCLKEIVKFECQVSGNEKVCFRILDSLTIKICCGMVAVVGVLLNLLCLVIENTIYRKLATKRKQTHHSYVLIISLIFIANFFYCVFLLILILTDIYYENYYLAANHKLHNSFLCLMISFSSAIFHLFSLFGMVLLLITSFKVVKDPINSWFLRYSFIKKVIIVGILSCLIITMVTVSKNPQLNQMCGIIGYVRSGTLLIYFTDAVASLHIVISGMKPVIHMLICKHVSKDCTKFQAMSSIKKQKLYKMIVKSIVSSFPVICSFLPSGVLLILVNHHNANLEIVADWVNGFIVPAYMSVHCVLHLAYLKK